MMDNLLQKGMRILNAAQDRINELVSARIYTDGVGILVIPPDMDEKEETALLEKEFGADGYWASGLRMNATGLLPLCMAVAGDERVISDIAAGVWPETVGNAIACAVNGGEIPGNLKFYADLALARISEVRIDADPEEHEYYIDVFMKPEESPAPGL